MFADGLDVIQIFLGRAYRVLVKRSRLFLVWRLPPLALGVPLPAVALEPEFVRRLRARLAVGKPGCKYAIYSSE